MDRKLFLSQVLASQVGDTHGQDLNQNTSGDLRLESACLWADQESSSAGFERVRPTASPIEVYCARTSADLPSALVSFPPGSAVLANGNKERLGLRKRRVHTSHVRAKSPLLRRDEWNDSPDWENPYPHTEAVYIHQVDITEDGLPPIPRAVASQQNLEIIMLVKDAQNLPEVLAINLSSPLHRLQLVRYT